MIKRIFMSVLILSCLAPLQSIAQIDTAGFETFVMEEEDTTYIMKKYFLCLYTSGPSRDQSEEEVRKIQEGHLANIQTMAENRIICMAGPLGQSDSNYRGILVFSVKNKETAIKWLEKDPAVKAGRLGYELYPWYAAVGSKLF